MLCPNISLNVPTITVLSLFMFYSNPSKSVILMDILSWCFVRRPSNKCIIIIIIISLNIVIYEFKSLDNIIHDQVMTTNDQI